MTSQRLFQSKSVQDADSLVVVSKEVANWPITGWQARSTGQSATTPGDPSRGLRAARRHTERARAAQGGSCWID